MYQQIVIQTKLSTDVNQLYWYNINFRHLIQQELHILLHEYPHQATTCATGQIKRLN